MASLWDMLDAARAAVDFARGMRFEDFRNDRRTRNAVERNLQIIGEAAKRISDPFRESNPHLPWNFMITLRNVLTHEYDEIRHEIIWEMCVSKLPDLIAQIETTGADSPPEDEEDLK
ncbi:DUF86 domain-containing protein [Candidatus Sumerlaeota bacterium]|nr:DUF86 domain-containing protein [Candidatus Sumerlaeota bacterium]